MAEIGASLVQFHAETGDEESVPAQSSNQAFAASQSPVDCEFVLKHEKNAFRSVWFMLLCGAILTIPGTICVVLFCTVPTSLTYAGWRLIHHGSGTDWRVCYLELLDGGSDYKPASLKGARVISSPPVPANFDIGTKDCSTFWSSGNTTDAYIGVILPQDVDIRLISMGKVPSEVRSCHNQTWCWTGCDSPSSCAYCCLKDEVTFLPDKVTVQRLGSSEWIDTYPDQDTDGSLETYRGMPPENTVRWVYFGIGIGCLTFGIGCLYGKSWELILLKHLTNIF